MYCTANHSILVSNVVPVQFTIHVNGIVVKLLQQSDVANQNYPKQRSNPHILPNTRRVGGGEVEQVLHYLTSGG